MSCTTMPAALVLAVPSDKIGATHLRRKLAAISAANLLRSLTWLCLTAEGCSLDLVFATVKRGVTGRDDSEW